MNITKQSITYQGKHFLFDVDTFRGESTITAFDSKNNLCFSFDVKEAQGLLEDLPELLSTIDTSKMPIDK